MGVDVGRGAVGGPPGVPDAEAGARQRLLGQQLLQVPELAGLLGACSSLRSSRCATPAESYPRYSSRRRPSTTTSSAACGPAYPTIPHMAASLPVLPALPDRTGWDF